MPAGRRQIALGTAAPLVLLATPGNALARTPKGFKEVEDRQDGYRYIYPFGWQEISVAGQVRVRPGAICCRVVVPWLQGAVFTTPTRRTRCSRM